VFGWFHLISFDFSLNIVGPVFGWRRGCMSTSIGRICSRDTLFAEPNNTSGRCSPPGLARAGHLVLLPLSQGQGRQKQEQQG
jgi:hypothetical protein